ncbi:MAG: hypothetical protein JWN98_559 [Abditibacteriota bacterium]|nr:hypothetical protein [Abditibacteriota bacterium]
MRDHFRIMATSSFSSLPVAALSVEPPLKVLCVGPQHAYELAQEMLRPYLHACESSKIGVDGINSRHFEIVQTQAGQSATIDVVLWWVSEDEPLSRYFDAAQVARIPVVAVVENEALCARVAQERAAGYDVFDVLRLEELSAPLLPRALGYAAREAHGQAQRVELAEQVQAATVKSAEAVARLNNEMSSRKFEALFHNPHTIMLLVDPQTRAIVDANVAACEFYGYTHEEFCKLTIPEINSKSGEQLDADIASIVAGHCRRFEFVHRLRDGSTREVEVHTGPIQMDDKVLLYSIVHDQTALRQSSRRQAMLSQGLHAVLSATDELLKYKNMATLLQRAVELAHEKLELERCTIFLVDTEHDEICGTYGVDDRGSSVDQSGVRFKDVEWWLHGCRPRNEGDRWVESDIEFHEWRDDRRVSLGKRGWVAMTLMQSEEGVVGSFHNDTAWTGKPLDPIQQELVAVYCSMLGNIIQRKRTEERLRTEEERFRLLAENSTDIISRTSPEGIILYTSPSHSTILGYEADEVIGTSVYGRVHPDDLEATLAFHAEPNDLPEIYRITARTQRKDGSYVWLETIGKPVRDEQGRIIEYHLASRDVSRRLEAEARRRESDERFRTFMDNTPAMTFIKDPQGHYLYFNKTTEKLFNASLEELAGKTNFDRLPLDVASQLRENDLKVLSTQQAHKFLEIVPTPDGKEHQWLTFKFPLRDAGGMPLLGGVAVDVTEQREYQEALARSEERLRTVIESVPLIIWAFDAQGIITFSEGKGLQLLGLRGGQAVGQSVYEMYREEAHALHNVQRVLKGEQFTDEIELRGIMFESRLLPMLDAEGNIIGAIGVLLDISERRRAEDRLRRSEMQMSEAQQLAHFGSWDWEIDSNRFSWSDELYRIYGMEPQSCEVTYDLFLDRVHPEDRNYVKQVLQNADHYQWPFHFFHRTLRPDGKCRVLHSRGVTAAASDGLSLRMIGTSQDVTEHKEAEEALQKSEERLRALVQSLDEIVFEFDEGGRYIGVWTHNESLLARPRTEILGCTVHDIFGGEAAQNFINAFKRIISGGEPETIEYALDLHNGRRWFLARISPIKTPDGSCTSVCMMARDITERREADDQLRRSEERFRLLVEGVKDYAICLLDSQGHIVSWNSGAQRLGGHHGDEILGRHFSCFYTPQEIAAGKPEMALDIARQQNRFEDEGPRVRSDQSTFYAHVVLTRLVDESGQERGFAQVTRDITEPRRAEQALHHYTARLENLLEIDQAFLAARSPREIADVALERLCSQIGCLHAAVTVFNFESDEALVLATLGDALEGLEAGQCFALSDVVPGLVAIDEESLLDHSTHLAAVHSANGTDKGRAEEGVRVKPQSKIFWQQRVERVEGGAPEASRFRSLPLIAQGDLVGVLDLEADVTEADAVEAGFSGEGWTIAHEVASQLAIAVQQARLFEQVRAGRAQLQVLSHRLIEAQEAERRHIARELHDEVGQVLTAVKLNLQGIQRVAQNPTGAKAASIEGRLDESIEIVEHALQQVRDLSLNLRPSLLDDLGLGAAMRWYIDRFAKRTEMRVRMQLETHDRFSSGIETACFRVAQEALTNVGRHAHAQNVLVQLRTDAEHLELTVHDDGTGFDVRAMRERAAGGSSMGLLGMEERASLAGGSLVIESAPDHGTTVRASFPCRLLDSAITLTSDSGGQYIAPASSTAFLDDLMMSFRETAIVMRSDDLQEPGSRGPDENSSPADHK